MRSRRAGAVASSRWVSVSAAIRTWAQAHPHQYSLITAAPCRGTPRRRTRSIPRPGSAVALLQIVVDGVASGEISDDWSRCPFPGRRTPISPDCAMRSLPACPTRWSRGTLLAWSQLFGSISLEMFGHLHNVIEDYETYFELQMRDAAEFLIAGVAGAERKR